MNTPLVLQGMRALYVSHEQQHGADTADTLAVIGIHAGVERLLQSRGPKATWDMLTIILDSIQIAQNKRDEGVS